MKRTRFTDEQIIGILAEYEAGAKCADLCRISSVEQTVRGTPTALPTKSGSASFAIVARINGATWLIHELLLGPR
nr:transposase [Rhodovulum sulfidophilum]